MGIGQIGATRSSDGSQHSLRHVEEADNFVSRELGWSFDFPHLTTIP